MSDPDPRDCAHRIDVERFQIHTRKEETRLLLGFLYNPPRTLLCRNLDSTGDRNQDNLRSTPMVGPTPTHMTPLFAAGAPPWLREIPFPVFLSLSFYALDLNRAAGGMEASSPLRSCAAQGRSSPMTTRGGPPPSEPRQVGRPGELAAHRGAMARTRAATLPASWPPTEERRRRRGLQRAAVLRWPPGGSREISSVFFAFLFFLFTIFCLQIYM